MTVTIDRSEVLRFLKYGGRTVDPAIDRLVSRCISEISEQLPDPALALYDIVLLAQIPEGVQLTGCGVVLPGDRIRCHLREAVKAAVMAVTLGPGVDARIRHYSRTGQVAMGMVMDACASAAVESLCANVEDEIRTQADLEGLFLTSRYSPGYGDLPLEVQPGLLDVLNARSRLGLSLTESWMLVPEKSVTAIVGFTRKPPGAQPSNCERCDRRENCPYRRG